MKNIRPSLALIVSAMWLLPLPASAACELDVAIKTTDGSKTRIVSQGEAIRTGQKIRIESRSQNGCYLLVFWKDSSDQVYNLTSEFEERRTGLYIDRNSAYVLPSEKPWFQLDHVPGIEQIVVVGSPAEITDPDKIGISLAMQEKPIIPTWLSSSQTLEVFSRALHHED